MIQKINTDPAGAEGSGPAVILPDRTEREGLRSMVIQAIDLLLALGLILLPLMSFGAYFKLVRPISLCGAAFGISVRFLKRLSGSRAARAAGWVLRGAAALILAACCAVLFGAGSHIRETYPLRRDVFIWANYTDPGEMFDFLPEELPRETEGLSMDFHASMFAQDSHGNIRISFTTDAGGMAQLLLEAEAKGGEPEPEDGRLTSKLKGLAWELGASGKGRVLSFGEGGPERAYYIGDDGFCLIWWS